MPLTPPDPTDPDRRIAITVAVRDTDAIPKVEGAGDVRDIDGRRVQVMHNGLLIDEGCYAGPFMTEIIRQLRNHHEPQEELVFHRIIERLADGPEGARRTMVELGAYWAYYSMWFARALPGATTVMVEPDPLNLDVGRRNFALNEIEGTFLQAAVGGHHGGRTWLQCESDQRVRRIPTVTLEGLMADHDLSTIDLVLCDTQGAELAVLEAARSALIAGRIRFLLISTHHQVFSDDPLTHQRCLALLEEVGAHIIAEHAVSESCSGDGLIAASMDERDAGFTVPVTRVRSRDSLFGEPEHAVALERTPSALARRQLARPLLSLQRLGRRRRAG